MTDRITREQRSRMMSAVRGKNTLPELSVRKALFAAGFRYRLHDRKLPGKPDIVLRKHRTVVMVHGCFWHGHSCPRGKRPDVNRAFWDRKIDSNIARDRKVQAALKAAEPVIARTAQKGMVHRKTASRKVSRLAKRIGAMGAP